MVIAPGSIVEIFGFSSTPTEGLRSFIVALVLVGSFCILALILFLRLFPAYKQSLITLVITSIIVIGTFLSSTALFATTSSYDGGLVDKGAELHIWACNTQLTLQNPTWPLSTLGSPTLFYRPNDQTIHALGPLSSPTLGNAFQSIGGSISDDSFTVPLSESQELETANNPEMLQPYITNTVNGAVAQFTSGNTCGITPANVEVSAFHYDAAQKQYLSFPLSRPATYILPQFHQDSPDCIVIQFGQITGGALQSCHNKGSVDE